VLEKYPGVKRAVKKVLRFGGRAVEPVNVTNARRKKKPLNLSGFSISNSVEPILLDDLDYAARAGVNQKRSVIDDRIAILANAVLGRNLIVGDACFREYRAHPYVTFVAVRGPVFFDDVMTEARTLIDAQNAVYTTNDAADRAANNRAHRPGSPLALSCTTFGTSGYALSGCRKRNYDGSRQKCRCNYLTKHQKPPV
jgi:hypothetical protein